jgi:hypothetical protein
MSHAWPRLRFGAPGFFVVLGPRGPPMAFGDGSCWGAILVRFEGKAGRDGAIPLRHDLLALDARSVVRIPRGQAVDFDGINRPATRAGKIVAGARFPNLNHPANMRCGQSVFQRTNRIMR